MQTDQSLQHARFDLNLSRLRHQCGAQGFRRYSEVCELKNFAKRISSYLKLSTISMGGNADEAVRQAIDLLQDILHSILRTIGDTAYIP